MTVILAIDAGTTGITGQLYGPDLVPIGRGYREFPQHFPRPGWVEHDARELLGALDEVLAELRSHARWRDVAAIGITNQRETVFALERATGAPLCRGIVWQDRRTASDCAHWRAEGRAEHVRERTGLVIDPYFSGSKIHWMLREVPGLRARAERGEVVFATVDSLVLHHLTGGERFATDFTNASRTMLLDIDRRDWDDSLGEWLGVERDWLASPLAPRSDFGTSAASLTGHAIPILGMVGDQQSALLGQGAVEPGATKNTYGTGCFLLVQSGSRRPADVRGFLTTLACDAFGGPSYALEGSLFMGGAIVQWLRDGLGIIADASEVEALARSVPDSGGVTLAPGFTGLGAPYWDPDARGALLGLTRGTTRAHIALAALESIALENAELIELVRSTAGLPIDRLMVDGGAAANDLLMQLQADFAATSVVRPADVEATARGAAVLAGLGAGLWERADSSPRSAAREFVPQLAEPDRRVRLADFRAALQRTLTVR